jgi:short-subunit dehydrogenase
MTRPGHRRAASAAVSRRRRLTLTTGAASGIGRAIAERCTARGAELVLIDVNAPALETTAAALAAAGARVRTYVLDVTDTSRIVGFREHVHRDARPLDVLVNNAGMVFGRAFLDLPLEQHLTTYRVNTLGLVAMTHAFLPDLLAGRDGHVVNVASASARIGLPESLVLELVPQGHRHVHSSGSASSIRPGSPSTAPRVASRPA